jgi:rare lipoprotein A
MRKSEWQYSAVAYLVLAAYTLSQWNVAFSYASSPDTQTALAKPVIALALPSAPKSGIMTGATPVSHEAAEMQMNGTDVSSMVALQAAPPAIQDAHNALIQEVEQAGMNAQQLDAARSVYLKHLPETLVFHPGVPEKQTRETTFRTVFNDSNNHAGLYVNDVEVFRFRADKDSLTPYLRSKQAAQRLYQSLEQTSVPQTLQLVKHSAQEYHLMRGTDLIVSVDAATAKAAGLSLDTVARHWKKQLQTALGASYVQADAPVVVVKKTPSPRVVAMAATPMLPEPSGNIKGRYAGTGMASWYGPGFHGRTAADGSRFNMYAMTAAHKTLPFGTRVRVTNTRNGQTCVVRITDRGPYAHGRIIDLSKAAAQSIGAMATGVAHVSLEVLR